MYYATYSKQFLEVTTRVENTYLMFINTCPLSTYFRYMEGTYNKLIIHVRCRGLLSRNYLLLYRLCLLYEIYVIVRANFNIT